MNLPLPVLDRCSKIAKTAAAGAAAAAAGSATAAVFKCFDGVRLASLRLILLLLLALPIFLSFPLFRFFLAYATPSPRLHRGSFTCQIQDLIGVEADDLKERAKVGYRGDRILRLAEGFRDGTVDADWLESPERTRCGNTGRQPTQVHDGMCSVGWLHYKTKLWSADPCSEKGQGLWRYAGRVTLEVVVNLPCSPPPSTASTLPGRRC